MPFPSSISPPAIFPIYLLPSLPFRRRSSTSTTVPDLSSSPTSPTSSTSSSPPAPSYLADTTSHLRCARCLTDLAPSSSIISKGFTGRHGRAYLVSPPTTAQLLTLGIRPSSIAQRDQGNLVNTHVHKAVPRQLVTGAHTVADISCAVCGSVVGWKYVDAVEEGQRYKVGKFILETRRICRGVSWEEEGVGGGSVGGGRGKGGADEEVEFDSQDEDECEDLFSGVWTPQLALKRRTARDRRRGWMERGD
ncbi:hypothetical protein W97_04772 [Coniosporium apollinis CBS 100218]|uniref:Yippee domain-containing protein n=1 Tax=Coniosporium apollinis (strain CBS 100218) TaxID=1168221 RepID=R7YUP6_CONA1|nr:uncharacterized protein W97_04772 [Coniosporium apollinis CBS 100218]EON65534.1 hypothetical protein W97_04772 [Coniosporium apollinis CBS 100218]